MNSQICSNISYLQTQIWIITSRLVMCLVYCDKELKKRRSFTKNLETFHPLGFVS